MAISGISDAVLKVLMVPNVLTEPVPNVLSALAVRCVPQERHHWHQHPQRVWHH